LAGSLQALAAPLGDVALDPGHGSGAELDLGGEFAGLDHLVNLGGAQGHAAAYFGQADVADLVVVVHRALLSAGVPGLSNSVDTGHAAWRTGQAPMASLRSRRWWRL